MLKNIVKCNLFKVKEIQIIDKVLLLDSKIQIVNGMGIMVIILRILKIHRNKRIINLLKNKLYNMNKKEIRRI